MSDPTPESVIAEALRQSRFADWDTTARRILEALAAHRMTVVTLPEPDSTSGEVRNWVTPVEDIQTNVFDEVVVGTLWWLQPYAARQFAAALLSAADVADRAGDDGEGQR